MRLSSAPVKADAESASIKPRQTLHRVADNLYRSDISGILYAILTKHRRQIRRSLRTPEKAVARARLEKQRGEILEAEASTAALHPPTVIELGFDSTFVSDPGIPVV